MRVKSSGTGQSSAILLPPTPSRADFSSSVKFVVKRNATNSFVSGSSALMESTAGGCGVGGGGGVERTSVDEQVLEFLSDGLRFDSNVVKTKAFHTLPYSRRYLDEVLQKRHTLDDNYVLESNKYRTRFFAVHKSQAAVALTKNSLRLEQAAEADASIAAITGNENTQLREEETLLSSSSLPTKKPFRFRQTTLFISDLTRSASSLGAWEQQQAGGNSLTQSGRLKRSGSLDQLFDEQTRQQSFFFLTEQHNLPEEEADELAAAAGDKQTTSRSMRRRQQRRAPGDDMKQLERRDWDDELIDQLSENTARWLVMRKVDNVEQQQRLNELVNDKFGRYTRNIKYLELIEESLTDFEKQKVAEEKRRIAALKEKKLRLAEKISDGNVGVVDDDDDENGRARTPLYRLPLGLKRIEVAKMHSIDTGHNQTARNVNIDTVQIKFPAGFNEKMKRLNVGSMSLLDTDNLYQSDILNDGVKHVFTKDESLIILDNGKSFRKTTQPVYPAEFTTWISGVELKPPNKPEAKKPRRGRKRWTSLPEFIDTDAIAKPTLESQISGQNTNYWHLLPTTPDTSLRKVLKSNLNVGKIVADWCRRWQQADKWKLAEIDELIRDMQDEEASVRFQAAVVCSRAAEKIQIMVEKFARYEKLDIALQSRSSPTKDGLSQRLRQSFPVASTVDNESARAAAAVFEEKKVFLKQSSMGLTDHPLPSHKSFALDDSYYVYDLFFSEKLMASVDALLDDANEKVRLAAAIAVFTILRKFSRPYVERYQRAKDRAERALRASMRSISREQRFAAAQCLAADLICNDEILDILLSTYFKSAEQVTKEQVKKLLANLSELNCLAYKTPVLRIFFATNNKTSSECSAQRC